MLAAEPVLSFAAATTKVKAEFESAALDWMQSGECAGRQEHEDEFEAKNKNAFLIER